MIGMKFVSLIKNMHEHFKIWLENQNFTNINKHRTEEDYYEGFDYSPNEYLSLLSIKHLYENMNHDNWYIV